MLKLSNTTSNYYATVVTLGKPIPHPNADRLEGFEINGYKVWYAKDMLKEGYPVIFFPIECQINPEIVSKLNLFSDKTLNADNTQSGYFGHQSRVKAIKLRGEPSEGFIMTINDFCTTTGMSEADVLASMDKHFDTAVVGETEMWICQKYEVPVRSGGGSGPKTKGDNLGDILIPGQFAFHSNTAKLQENVHHIDPSDTILITKKLHGTSAVFANVLVKRKLNWKERIAKVFGVNVNEQEYKRIYSSRTIIKHVEDKYHTEKQGYYNNDIWGRCFLDVRDKLEEGITLYGEIVGYTGSNSMIQKGYDYGCAPGEYEFYVYRITHTDPFGRVFEYNWNAIKNYCDHYNLKYVPELFFGKAGDIVLDWRNSFLETLKQQFLERKCNMCKNNVPDEGIVVRNETGVINAWKLKSFAFLERETKQLDEDTDAAGNSNEE